MDPTPVRVRNRISDETIRRFYPIVKAVAEKTLPRPTGIQRLVDEFGLNENSARDFIDNFGKMLRGEEYQRLNTIFGTDFFLQKISDDFGAEALRNAVSSVDQHLTYYQGASGRGQPGIRKVLAKYMTRPGHTVDPTEAVHREARKLQDKGEFDPDNITDGRRWILTSIARRQGRPEFRESLVNLYNGRCAISGSSVLAVLEAAHIIPYLGPETNHPSNGLLLRSDFHTLFDLGLIAVDPTTMTVLVSPKLKGSTYARFAGSMLRLPKNAADRPSAKALSKHREGSGL